VLIAIADTTGGMKMKNIPVAITMTHGPPLVNTMMRRVKTMTANKCSKCIHSWQETLDDVACCNVCEEGEVDFFEEERDEYTLADLGWNWW
jgi:hypothetical protein